MTVGGELGGGLVHEAKRARGARSRVRLGEEIGSGRVADFAAIGGPGDRKVGTGVAGEAGFDVAIEDVRGGTGDIADAAGRAIDDVEAVVVESEIESAAGPAVEEGGGSKAAVTDRREGSGVGGRPGAAAGLIDLYSRSPSSYGPT